jgi:hypothetical protein
VLTSSQYRGLYPNGKIAFTDIGTGSSSTLGPIDIAGYMQHVATNFSANIIVGAYGSTAPVTWCTSTDQDVDSFLYVNNQVVAVFAAGNFGQTSGTTNAPGVQLVSPAVAKNVITVGASQNDAANVAGAFFRCVCSLFPESVALILVLQR